MKKSRYTKSQIVKILEEVEGDRSTPVDLDLRRDRVYSTGINTEVFRLDQISLVGEVG